MDRVWAILCQDNDGYYIDIKKFVNAFYFIVYVCKKLIYDKQIRNQKYDAESMIFVQHVSIWILFNKYTREQYGPFRIKYVLFSREYFEDKFIKWIHEYINCKGM